MLRYLTAGESHGKAMVALVEGFPAGVQVRTEPIDAELRRRQGGYGRGGRQQIETDRVEILTGLWRGQTIGSPITLIIYNKDVRIDQLDDLDSPRPGHGDLSGAMKYLCPIRGILERASARETVARVAVGALAKQLLELFRVKTLGYVVQVGPIRYPEAQGSLEELRQRRDASLVYSLHPDQDGPVQELIDQCRREGDSLGGVIEVRVEGVPFGLGSHAQWDRKLDGQLAQAVMSIQAIKGVEIGLGFEAAGRRGSQVHDPIHYDPSLADTPCLGFVRPTNNAGGLEAGMSNAQPIVLRAAMKPISTLARPLASVNLRSRRPELASYERSDVCAIAAASVIVENVVAFEVARALVDKFGGDSLAEMQARWQLFHQMAAQLGRQTP
ncbi:MAG: chorismate synthase [Thermoguttaceae bacterium]|nr:chorismate synthase [Thermoguttaceae bacterium]MDW8036501.1 chorismate synthase [Thermoguttaceae bacterium]